ncbi:MAG: amidohydrolase [Actinomycetota bacterium]|nr:amidohydrolase [Actinomycetota bacterium]
MRQRRTLELGEVMSPSVQRLPGARVGDWIDAWADSHAPQLVEMRRTIHAHPELGYVEHQTTDLVTEQLRTAGLTPTVLEHGTGAVCDVGTGDRVVVLRADIDALPLFDTKTVDYRSQIEGVAHACGHDAHTAILLGTARLLAELAATAELRGELPEGLGGIVRCVFQPAEEQVPGGALEVLKTGALDGVLAAFALHCDPTLPVGSVGLKAGPITAACDAVKVTLTGPGGHTARPHMTVDLVDALGRVILGTPGLLSRQIDPRAGLSLVWGAVGAGIAANTIPETGTLHGTVRLLERDSWDEAEKLIRRLIAELVAPTGAQLQIDYQRGVPPVVNAPWAIDVLREAAQETLEADGVRPTEQSLGGEDFAWYADHAPIGLARLGTYGGGPPLDLHRGSFDIDERALAIGVRLLARTALRALAGDPG